MGVVVMGVGMVFEWEGAGAGCRWLPLVAAHGSQLILLVPLFCRILTCTQKPAIASHVNPYP